MCMKFPVYIFLIVSLLFFACTKDSKTNCELFNKEHQISDLSYKGCGDFMVYDVFPIEDDSSFFISVSVERKKLDLGNEFRTFIVGNNPAISASIEKFNMAASNYCTDLMVVDLERENIWMLESGTVSIRIVRDRNQCENTYVVDLLINEASFLDSEKNKIQVENKEFRNVLVNYVLG